MTPRERYERLARTVDAAESEARDIQWRNVGRAFRRIQASAAFVGDADTYERARQLASAFGFVTTTGTSSCVH